jgi:hypothetical protein
VLSWLSPSQCIEYPVIWCCSSPIKVILFVFYDLHPNDVRHFVPRKSHIVTIDTTFPSGLTGRFRTLAEKKNVIRANSFRTPDIPFTGNYILRMEAEHPRKLFVKLGCKYSSWEARNADRDKDVRLYRLVPQLLQSVRQSMASAHYPICSANPNISGAVLLRYLQDTSFDLTITDADYAWCDSVSIWHTKWKISQILLERDPAPKFLAPGTMKWDRRESVSLFQGTETQEGTKDWFLYRSLRIPLCQYKWLTRATVRFCRGDHIEARKSHVESARLFMVSICRSTNLGRFEHRIDSKENIWHKSHMM